MTFVYVLAEESFKHVDTDVSNDTEASAHYYYQPSQVALVRATIGLDLRCQRDWYFIRRVMSLTSLRIRMRTCYTLNRGKIQVPRFICIGFTFLHWFEGR
jgi:hypothetical protein